MPFSFSNARTSMEDGRIAAADQARVARQGVINGDKFFAPKPQPPWLQIVALIVGGMILIAWLRK